MKRKQELEKVSKEFANLSLKINAIKYHLKNLEKELARLTRLKRQFEQNLHVLKSPKIISTVSEYKLSKENLRAINNRMKNIQVFIADSISNLEKTEKILCKAKEKYDKLAQSNATVLKGNFGKNGQK